MVPPTMGKFVEQMFYGWMPFLTPTLPTLEPMRVLILLYLIVIVIYVFRFPNLAVCNITRDSVRAALSMGITADQVSSLSMGITGLLAVCLFVCFTYLLAAD